MSRTHLDTLPGRWAKAPSPALQRRHRLVPSPAPRPPGASGSSSQRFSAIIPASPATAPLYRKRPAFNTVLRAPSRPQVRPRKAPTPMSRGRRKFRSGKAAGRATFRLKPRAEWSHDAGARGPRRSRASACRWARWPPPGTCVPGRQVPGPESRSPDPRPGQRKSYISERLHSTCFFITRLPSIRGKFIIR